MTDYKQLCAELVKTWDATADFDYKDFGNAVADLVDRIRAAFAEPESANLEQGVQQMQPFVVRHYTEDERPTIKGNGFDGLEIGEDREEAEAFVAWINEKLARLGQ